AASARRCAPGCRSRRRAGSAPRASRCGWGRSARAPRRRKPTREGMRPSGGASSRALLTSPMRFSPALVDLEKSAHRTPIPCSPQKLGPYAHCITEWLVQGSARDPARLLLAERKGEAWRRISYREAYGAVRRIGQALLDRGLGAEKPVAILSDNAIDHALLAL